MRRKASAVQQSLIGTYLPSNKYPYCLSIHNPLYKLSSFSSHQLPMSYATKVPNPLFCKPFPQCFNSKTSSLAYTKFFFAKPITFQSIPTKPISARSSLSNPGDDDLPPKLKETVKLFQAVDQPKAKYEQLMFYGRNLKPLDAQYKTAENKVHGCVSQVWVRAYVDENKHVFFEADSDTLLTKGLAALLVQGLSGCSVDTILRISPDFIVQLGLQQSLTQSRSNGFLNMLKLMQKKAQMCVESEKAESLSHKDNDKMTESSNDNGNPDLTTEESLEESDSVVLGSRGMRIRDRLERELRPLELHVRDVSYQHAGHAGIRGTNGGETHFNVTVVSEKFEGKSLVKRHRLVYGLLQEELSSGLHALSIVAKTPSEVNIM